MPRPLHPLDLVRWMLGTDPVSVAPDGPGGFQFKMAHRTTTVHTR